MVDWNNIEYLKEAIKISNNKTDVLNKLGLKNNGGNFKTLDKFIKDNNIDIKHFIKGSPNVYVNKSIRYKNTNEILIENSPYKNTTHLKIRLYKEKLKERKCEKCGQGEEWRGERMSLILDHINGINDDNRIENLQIVCPNCNATLITHCRGNVNDDFIKNKDICECGNVKTWGSSKCIDCYKIECINKKYK